MIHTTPPPCHLLSDQMPALFLILNLDFEVIAVSHQYLIKNHQSKQEVVGHSLADLFFGDNEKQTGEMYAELLSSLKKVIMNKDSERVLLKNKCSGNSLVENLPTCQYHTDIPLLDKNGNLVYILHTIEEASQQELLECNLIALLEKNPVTAFLVDQKGYIRSANSKAVSLYGYTKAKMTGIKLEALFDVQSRDLCNAQIEQYSCWEMEAQTLEECELSGLRSDGSVFPAVLSISREITNGDILLTASIKDISNEKKRKAEVEYLSMLVEHSSEAIISITSSLNITSINTIAAKLFGFNSQDIIGLRVDDLGIFSLSGKEIIDLLKVGTENRLAVKEVICTHNKGFTFSALLTIRSIENAFENASCISLTITNTSYKKQLETRWDMLSDIAKVYPGLIYTFQQKTDGTFCFLYTSTGIENIFGLNYNNVADNANLIIEATHPGDKEMLLESIAASARDMSPWNLQFRYLHPTRGLIWLEGDSIPTKHVDGSIIWHGLINDVTERKLTNELLNEQRAQLQTLIDNLTGVMIFQLTGDTYEERCFSYVGKEVSRLTGKTPDEIMNDPSILYGLILEEDVPRLIAAEKEAFKRKSLFNVEVRSHSISGEIRWLNIISSPREVEKGKIVWDGFFVDITDRKNAELSIRESEEKYRALVEQAFDGVIIYSADGCILDCNQSATINTGYSKKEMLAMNIADFFSAADLNSYPVDIEAIKPGKSTFDRRKLRRKNGQYITLEIVTQLMQDGRLLAVGRDITEKYKAIEERELLASIISNSDDAIISMSLDGEITSWNKAAEKIYGYHAPEIIGKNISLLLPEDFRADTDKIISAVTRGDVIQHFETTRKKKFGVIIDVSITASPIRNTKGKIIGISKIVRDITDRKVAEQERDFIYSNLHALINNTHDIIWSVDREFNLISSNQAFDSLVERMTGEKLSTGSHLLEHTYDRAFTKRYREYYEKAFSGRTFTELEYVQHPKELWTEISFYPIYKDQKVVGTACFSRNITERIRIEERLKLSNERYEAVAKATSDGIWDFSFDTGKTFIVGSGYKHLFGYKIADEYIEPGFWESRLHPEDKERVLAELEATINNPVKKHSSSEYRFLKADGTYTYLYDRFFIFRQKGKPVRMLGAKQDITLRKNAEIQLKNNLEEKKALVEKLASILNTLPANIALLNEHGVIMDVNDEWKKFAKNNNCCQYDCGLGESYETISAESIGLDEKDRSAVVKGIESVLKHKTKEFVFEYAWNKAGQQRWFRMVTMPILHKKSGAVVMHIDISELRRLEKERLESKIEEQKKITLAMLAGQEKERNSIGIELHDNVNQILVGTKVLLSVVRDNPERSAELAETCIENIALAIQENRKIAHELVTPNLVQDKLLKQISRLCDKMLHNAGFRTVINHKLFSENKMRDELKLAVYRVIQEQCTNIVKYAKGQQVVFTLSTIDKKFHMRIADDGQGMAQGKVTKGIGLQNIASRLSVFGGSASVETAPGKGFALIIQVPL
jgi:PAS domain S-box-containing protein